MTTVFWAHLLTAGGYFFTSASYIVLCTIVTYEIEGMSKLCIFRVLASAICCVFQLICILFQFMWKFNTFCYMIHVLTLLNLVYFYGCGFRAGLDFLQKCGWPSMTLAVETKTFRENKFNVNLKLQNIMWWLKMVCSWLIMSTTNFKTSFICILI